MIQFTKLRLSGFKSFVDKSELEIGSGLNGVVGPNGCGKSNLLEALRWVMGESSAKKMRGGGMEDVIFNGTDKRSARNFAEVTLLLDNSTRQAPASYNNVEEIEVSRKIEKDKGSGYRINGKLVRARDVQMLFADTVTGANSPSMVSQGHVARMINAKPHDRRLVLEESAGIAGLYARRHEAELRLKSADTNLTRLEDILGSMESRLNSLKRQSRQAARYKNLSSQIRQFDLAIIYLEWITLIEKQKNYKKKYADIESNVSEKMITVSQLTKTQNTQIEELPPLRKKEAEIFAKLQKHKLDFQRAEEELERYKNDLQEVKTQLHQINIDYQHEEQSAEETATMLEKIDFDYKTLIEEQESDESFFEAKNKKVETLKTELIQIEELYSALKEDAAANTVRLEGLKNQVERHEQRKEVILSRIEIAKGKKASCVIDDNLLNDITAVEKQILQSEDSLRIAKENHDKITSTIHGQEEITDKARGIYSDAEKRFSHVTAEINTLEQFFISDKNGDFESVLEQVRAKDGFEKALSRAMGDSLTASLDDNAPAYWQSDNSNIDKPLFPEGVTPLISFIQAPNELHIALSYVGFVASNEEGKKYSRSLKAGQSLVSSEGAYWRWDGYFIQENAADRHSIYLEQKNKQSNLNKKKQVIAKELENAKQELEYQLSLQDEHKQDLRNVNEEIKSLEQKLNAVRPQLQKLKDNNSHIESERNRFIEQIKALEEDLESVQEILEDDKCALDALIKSQSSGDKNEQRIREEKEKLDRIKERYQGAVRDFDIFTQNRNTRRARIQAIADERLSLKNRNIRAKERIKELGKRKGYLESKLKELEENPISRKCNSQDLLNNISELEIEKNLATESLVACEEYVSVTNKALKEAEAILGDLREERAHAKALLSSLNDQITEMEQSVNEKHNVHPKDLVNHAAIDLINYTPQDLPKLKQDSEKLIRDRDSIGPVNLQAEEESTDLEKELSGILYERNDLVQAIEELRGGINKINKEAREKLLAAFEHVNAHFQDLFVRLFAGGKAYLKLIDSDDPLGAGLEIYAQPPGKSLQALSLLSGGEQTLTSIALIFAMFMTNPSPICVLDEIDAALDDANVDRVCDLLDEISERGETRFLVVTHHRLTMARMDRLYGVTMSEKGVSQLVSVDLQKSFEFIDQKVA